MRPLGSAQLLDLGERGRSLGTSSRSAMVIATACPELSHAEIIDLPLGQAGQILLAVRRATIPGPISTSQPCQACGEPIALEFDPAEFEAQPRLSAPGPDAIALRLGDLIAVEGEADPGQIKRRLAERISPGMVDRLEDLSALLEEADPDADICCATVCPNCEERQELLFDPGQFLWEEINARVPRILREVAELARAYHWSEHDILAMSGERRAFYLGMVQ